MRARHQTSRIVLAVTLLVVAVGHRGAMARPRVVTAGEIRGLIEAEIMAWARREGDVRVLDVTLDRGSGGAPIRTADHGGLEVTVDVARLARGHRTMAEVTYLDVRSRRATRWIPVEVTLERAVLKLTAPVPRGRPVTRDVVEVAWVRRPYPLAMRDPEALEGLVARRDLPAGTVLAAGFLERPIIVARGDRVSLVARRGALEIEAPGEALERGRAGDTVRVRVAAGRVVRAKVVAPRRVEVLF